VDLVGVSNRGPLIYTAERTGRLVGHQGAGGLVSSLGPLVVSAGATWVAAAMTDTDRAAARTGVIHDSGYRLVLLALDPEQYRMAYEDISNATLCRTTTWRMWARPSPPHGTGSTISSRLRCVSATARAAG
jgi:trehalose 6-phosphate synthase